MEKMLQRYIRWHKSVKHTAKTIRYHEQTITYFCRWLLENGYPTTVEDLHVDMAREWVEYMQEAGKSDYTVATRVRSLRAFTNWLVQEEWITKDPFRRLQVPTVEEVVKETLTPQQVDTLLSVCDKNTLNGLRDRAIILTLFSTGIRAEELCKLNRDDIDPGQGLIRIRRGKGGKFRVVPLGVKVDRAIDRYLAKRDDDLPYLFTNEDGKQLVYSALRQIMRRRGAKAGIHANPHLFRHSFAIEYLRSGGKLEALNKIMGHSTFEMTLWYAKLAGVDIAAAHEDYDPTLRLKSK